MSLQSEILVDGPVLYWPMTSIVSGLVPDLGPNSLPGTIYTPYTQPVAGISAAVGTAIQFSGGRIERAANSVFRPAANYTVEMILNWTGTNYGLAYGVFNGSPPYNGPTVFVNWDQTAAGNDPGMITFRDSGDPAYALKTGGSLNDGTFRHFAFVRRGLSLEIWINGVLAASKSIASLLNVTDSATLFSMGRPSLQTVNGAKQHLAVYNHALSGARILLHYRRAASLYRLAGSAVLDTGAAADRVLVRDWDSYAHLAEVIPDVDGVWETFVPGGSYDVTTFGPEGYQPICHGPMVPEEE